MTEDGPTIEIHPDWLKVAQAEFNRCVESIELTDLGQEVREGHPGMEHGIDPILLRVIVTYESNKVLPSD